MSLSGIILYLAPAGRIGRWIAWTMLGFSRSQWEDIHTISSYLFIGFGLVHLFSMNWRPFISYMRNRLTKRMNRRRELAMATATFLVVTLFTVAKIPPVYSIMDLGNHITALWADRYGVPPVPHAERMTIEEAAIQLFDTDPDSLIVVMRASGIELDGPYEVMRDVAGNNRMSPAALFGRLCEYFTPVIFIEGTGGRPD